MVQYSSDSMVQYSSDSMVQYSNDSMVQYSSDSMVQHSSDSTVLLHTWSARDTATVLVSFSFPVPGEGRRLVMYRKYWCGLMYSIQYKLVQSRVQCTMYSIPYTVYSIQHTVYSIHYTAYSVQRTAYSVQRTVATLQTASVGPEEWERAVHPDTQEDPPLPLPLCKKSQHLLVLVPHFLVFVIFLKGSFMLSS